MSIPVTELKEAAKAFNKVLPAGSKIKLVPVKKDRILADLTKKIVESLDAGTEAELPDEVIEFYNNHIATDEAEEEAPAGDEAPAEEEAKAPSTAKKGKASGAKTTKPAKEKAPRKKSLPGENTREASVVAAMKDGGTADEIIAASDAAYVKAGGTSNLPQTKRLFDRGVKYFHAAGLVSLEGDVYSLNL